MRLVIWLVGAALSLGQPASPTEAPGLAWTFAAGRPSERLAARAIDMPASAEVVRLPHRVLRPNTALWYARDLEIPPDHAIVVEADDGAQVFVDGHQAPGVGRSFAVPRQLTRDRHGPHRVVIRVLNNAMHGGLRSVRVVRTETVARKPPGPAPPGFPPVESEAFTRRMPAPSAPCRFTAWADSQGGWSTFAHLAARMATIAQDFSVGVGDLVDDGSDPDAWRAFLATAAPLARHSPVVAIAGNHDYDGAYDTLTPRHYLDLFRPPTASPWFAWSCGPARFVALDMNTEFPIGITDRSPQARWLDREVASDPWRKAVWRVLLVHQPPYSVSWEGYGGDEAVRRIVERLVETHRLDLVIAGHAHAYEHLIRRIGGRTLHVLITGGAGGSLEAPSRTVTGAFERVVLAHHYSTLRADTQSLEVRVEDANGLVLDAWHLGR